MIVERRERQQSRARILLHRISPQPSFVHVPLLIVALIDGVTMAAASASHARVPYRH
jgi:hypothetical protein